MLLSEEPERTGAGVAREYAVEIRCAGVADEDLTDEIPEIGGDREIAPLIELLGLDAR